MSLRKLYRADGSVLCPVRIAQGFWDSLLGSAGGLDAGLVLETNAVHLFWGPAPLDLIFLSKDLSVLRVQVAAPRGAIRACWSAAYVLEIRTGSVACLPTPGERLAFTP